MAKKTVLEIDHTHLPDIDATELIAFLALIGRPEAERYRPRGVTVLEIRVVEKTRMCNTEARQEGEA